MGSLMRMRPGVTYDAVRRRILAGDVRRVRRGLYALAEVDLTHQVMAAIARLGGVAVASHETAAALWRIPLLGRPDAQIHVTRPRRGQGTVRDYPDLVVHHAALPETHRAHQRSVPVTNPARTVADLARSSPFRVGVVAADAALRTRLCERQELAEVVRDCAGWPGIRAVRSVIEFADPASASPLESISRVAFAEFGLPAPQTQAPIGPFDIADFLWPAYRVVGEADGLGKYTDVRVLRAEKLRQERFAQEGYEVVRWTWAEVYRRPDAVAHRVLEVLRRRGYRVS